MVAVDVRTESIGGDPCGSGIALASDGDPIEVSTAVGGDRVYQRRLPEFRGDRPLAVDEPEKAAQQIAEKTKPTKKSKR